MARCSPARVAWRRSRFITAAELTLLTHYLNGDAAQRAKQLEAKGVETVQTVLTLLSKVWWAAGCPGEGSPPLIRFPQVSKEDTLRALLVVLDDLLAADPGRVALVHAAARASGVPAVKPLVYQLESKKDHLVTHLVRRFFFVSLRQAPRADPFPFPAW